MQSEQKKRSPKNKTLVLSAEERALYKNKLVYPASLAGGVSAVCGGDRGESGGVFALKSILNKILCADLLSIIDSLPPRCADLLFIDPPYNLDKDFHGFKFSKSTDEDYTAYLESWFPRLLKTLKPTASVYLCGDWKSSSCLYAVMKKYTVVRNRIIWQREKGRGAKANWKNACEDIWFGTMGTDYYFNADAVKQNRRVLAPYL